MGLFRPYLRFLYKFFFYDRRYAVLEFTLRNTSRYTERTVQVGSWTLTVPDSASFLSAYKEIFVQEIYKFKSATTSPRILDLGANIGLSILYFKQLYPGANITGVEADPTVFECLKNNLYRNGFADVQLIQKAVWTGKRIIRFNSEGSDAGRVGETSDTSFFEVETVDMRDLIGNYEIDLLKMDIEGAEKTVVPASQEHLGKIKRIFIEYHSEVNQPQKLDKIIAALSSEGFRLHIHNLFQSRSPFVDRLIHSGFDLQLNIFGWKEE